MGPYRSWANSIRQRWREHPTLWILPINSSVQQKPTSHYNLFLNYYAAKAYITNP